VPTSVLTPLHLTVDQVMSPRVASIRSDATVGEALDRFLLTGSRQLVVLDAAGRAIAVLSDRDVMAAWPLDSWTLQRRTVGTLVDLRAAHCVTAGTELQDAALMMLGGHREALAVLDGGEVVGVVTDTDLVRVIAHLPSAGQDATAPDEP
jgi:CBS domain-containing protein